MTRSRSISPLGSEFNDFLLAPIGEDYNGMLLTVLSALARLDVDPWVEAAKLARLPGETAVQELASLIAALPDGPSARPDPGTIAARLIALLPHRVSSDIRSPQRVPGVRTVNNFPAVTYLLFSLILLIVMLFTQWLEASRQAPAPVDTASAPVSSAPNPLTHPTNSISDDQRLSN